MLWHGEWQPLRAQWRRCRAAGEARRICVAAAWLVTSATSAAAARADLSIVLTIVVALKALCAAGLETNGMVRIRRRGGVHVVLVLL